jgi:cytochrome P450
MFGLSVIVSLAVRWGGGISAIPDYFSSLIGRHPAGRLSHHIRFCGPECNDRSVYIRRYRSTVPGPRGAETATALFALARSPLDGYVRLAAAYGDTVRVPFTLGRSFYLLSRPEHAEHVLAANQDNYVKASTTFLPLRALIGDGLLTSEGDRWRRHRRLVQPLFSRRHVAAFGPAMAAAAQRMAARWDLLPEGSVIDVPRQLSALALDVLGRALFGCDLTDDAGQMVSVMDAAQRVALLAPFLPLARGPASTRALEAAARRVGGAGGGIEAVARRIMSAHGGTAPLGDLVDVLMNAGDRGGSPLTATEVEDELATFLLAGHETSATALSWALALLSAHPAARQRLEAEVDGVAGNRDLDADDVARLPWTRAVVAEAMRLYPPAWTIERDALADDEVAGTPVPAGSLVVVPPYLVHRHPDVWPDPSGFDPCRFMHAQAPGRGAAPSRYAYIPFGGGRRACVGASFAELETVLVLATITRRFRLELTGRGVPAPVGKITLRPGRELPMRLLRRG